MTGGGQVDPYAELGVSRDASSQDIRRAYRHVARRNHPDVNHDPGGPERFAAAALAYEILSNPAARARYDNRLPGPARSADHPTPEPRWAGAQSSS
jgi:curved DNA-binding protein CbpA